MRNVATRDRYVDLLRVTSLGVVVVGHWLMAVVTVGPDGSVTATNLLAVVPALRPLTWLLQVMPVFFLVGGFAHATALRRGPGYAGFVRTRAARLLRPTAVFVAVWLAFAVAVEVTGQDRGVLRLATRIVAQPLWFVGVYLGVIALAPAMHRLHRRAGRYALAVPAGLAAAVALVDVARFGFGVPYVSYVTVALAWLAVHQLGFLYADGTLHKHAATLAGGGLVATVLLTTFGPYPVSMVGLPGDRVSNMSPPTLALLAHAAWLTGLVLLLRGPVTRWLHRPAVWTRVVAANMLSMTAFLWHLTAMFVVTGLTVAAGWTSPPVGSAAWWLLRPLWFAVLVVLILAFRWADAPRPARPGGPSAGWPAAAGMALCATGVLALSTVGFGGALAGRTATLVVLPVTPFGAVALIAAGAALLWAQRWATTGSARSDRSGSRGEVNPAPTQTKPAAAAIVAGSDTISC
jgi:hypothetical protein